VGADVDEVARAMGLDRRIGGKFLHAGVGYGGSCLPKDVAAIMHTADDAGVPLRVIRAAAEVNRTLMDRLVEKIQAEMPALAGKTVAVLGLSFKPNTDDVRESPALRLVDRLLAQGARVKGYDPAAIENVRRVYGERISYCEDSYDAVRGADALVIMTEWNEFRLLDLDRVMKLLRSPVVFDCRNIYQSEAMEKMGFRYHSFGRTTR
jgi:UDPglucose 6-dehydrogenase